MLFDGGYCRIVNGSDDGGVGNLTLANNDNGQTCEYRGIWVMLRLEADTKADTEYDRDLENECANSRQLNFSDVFRGSRQ